MGIPHRAGTLKQFHGNSSRCWSQWSRLFVGWQNGYGQLVVVDHGGGLSTRYGHLSHIDVEPGQQLSMRSAARQGRIDRSFNWASLALHEVRINDEPVNPLHYLLMNPEK